MQCTVHHKVLEDIFTNKTNPIASSVITSSLLGVTKSILEEYNSNLRNNPLFTAWFASATQYKRFKPVTSSTKYLFPDLSGMHSDYLVATYYCGLRFIYSLNCVVNTVDKNKLQNWGIDVFSMVNLPETSCNGDNPVEYIRLTNGGNITPFALKKYFIKENKIIVFDKYFKAGALDVVVNLCKCSDPNATITIITSNQPNSISETTINTTLRSECPMSTVYIKYMSQKTFNDLHDRYIFIGDRYVIKFTKGIDCFYKRAGCWANKIGDVIVDDNQIRFSNYKIEMEDTSHITVKLST